MEEHTCQVHRIYAEKKEAYAVEAQGLLLDLQENFALPQLKSLRILRRYDVQGVDAAIWEKALPLIFFEATVDHVYKDESEDLKAAWAAADYILPVQALPGQYDQRADFAAQCLQLLSRAGRPALRCANIYLFKGELTPQDHELLRRYFINPVEAEEASLSLPENLLEQPPVPADIEWLSGFITADTDRLAALHSRLGLAMSRADLAFTQQYFQSLQREPSMTEIRVLDTYWSDHCRHTTFNTRLRNIVIGEADEGACQTKSAGEAGDLSSAQRGVEDGASALIYQKIKASLDFYQQLRKSYYGKRSDEKALCLMDLATLAAKQLRKDGYVPDLDESDEINACSIQVDVPLEDGTCPMLLMFKNETHNHPTEIEPFGGAATCLGGAIRDPLSGRAYVYQAMRVTGAADPTQPAVHTIPGKLPQRKITVGAAAGFSSYGNQIGLAAGQVREIYHPAYMAKRMEIGAVMAAVPADQVVREKPEPGDVIVLLGGRTGRDGIGGATGSSKIHDQQSVARSGSEVQKGNPPTERALQRLFRRPDCARLIRRCNDFGAGGVCVAIGELAAGVEIDLDQILVKYDGLDGTELAISESQERMAVVLRPELLPAFIAAAQEENLEARCVARVTAEARMRMNWRGKTIVDLERSFIDSNGAEQQAEARLVLPDVKASYFKSYRPHLPFAQRLQAALGELNAASQKDLVERFDNSIGAGTVLHPFGGMHQLTPEIGMAALIPLPQGPSTTASLMSFGFDPELSSWSPYHGAYLAVAESLAKLTALGASPQKARLSFQEYFPRTDSPEKWGLPLAALLGAFQAQMDFHVPAIGGKDSMSGNFNELEVPPTLVSFAVASRPVEQVRSSVLKTPGRELYIFPLPLDAGHFIQADLFMQRLSLAHKLSKNARTGAMTTVTGSGAAVAVVKQCLGNRLGFSFNEELTQDFLFLPQPGALIMELVDDGHADESEQALRQAGAVCLGRVTSSQVFSYGEAQLTVAEAIEANDKPLRAVFSHRSLQDDSVLKSPDLSQAVLSERAEKGQKNRAPFVGKKTEVSVFIPVFPGTNCEYDSAAAFAQAGAQTDVFVFRNQSPQDLTASLLEMEKRIRRAQIVMLPGGFSAGDEPEGSGKFIATVFREARLCEALRELLFKRDGLMLGICNGFQALIKLGLLPYGDITKIEADSPTLTYNHIGRHVATYVQTRVSSTKSPWLSQCQIGDIHSLPVSHGEGRFIASHDQWLHLMRNGQVCTQYVDLSAQATLQAPYNPNGSVGAVEGICSPDGRIFGKMAHSERVGTHVAINIPGPKDQQLFRAGVNYFL